MNGQFQVPGPGTGMAIAAGLAAHGAATGDLPHPEKIIFWFLIATLFIEVLHTVIVPWGKQKYGIGEDN